MTDAYGKLYASTRDLVVASDGLTVNALRLFVWMLPYFRDGNLLQGREAALLDEWLDERGYLGEAKAVQVVQFSLGQAAADLFNGHKTEAKRQVKRLESSRVIEPLGKAARGHAQLFAVNPNRYTSEPDKAASEQPAKQTASKREANAKQTASSVPNGVTSECVPIEDSSSNKVTSECVPTPNRYTSEPNKYTSDGEWVHIQGRIGTHPEPVTCDDETHPELYPEVYPEKEKNKESRCPRCGAGEVEATSAGLYCVRCNAITRR